MGYGLGGAMTPTRGYGMVKPRTLIALACVGLLTALVSPVGLAQNPTGSGAAGGQRGGQEEFGDYEVVPNWPQPLPDGPDGVSHAGWTWGSMGSVYAETPNRIWIAMRGELPLPVGTKPWTAYGLLTPPRGNATGNEDGFDATCKPVEKRGWERRYHHTMFVVDAQGKLVQSWPQMDQLFDMHCGRGPHRIKMSPYDPEKHVWIVDDQLHVIYKFTYDGKLVMTLGTKGQRGRDAGRLFDRPTDVAWLPDGTFFITDGYGGKRVAKFSPDGKFITDWGSAAKDPAHPQPYEFNTVHGIAISKDRRLFVVDRNNSRIQIFDENGKFLDMWSTGVHSAPYSQILTDDQHLWLGDGGTSRILKYDLNGKYLYGWGVGGPLSGQLDGPHGLAVDQDGNLYVAEAFNGRVQKFRPRQGADPAKLVGQEQRYVAH